MRANKNERLSLKSDFYIDLLLKSAGLQNKLDIGAKIGVDI